MLEALAVLAVVVDLVEPVLALAAPEHSYGASPSQHSQTNSMSKRKRLAHIPSQKKMLPLLVHLPQHFQHFLVVELGGVFKGVVNDCM